MSTRPMTPRELVVAWRRAASELDVYTAEVYASCADALERWIETTEAEFAAAMARRRPTRERLEQMLATRSAVPLEYPRPGHVRGLRPPEDYPADDRQRAIVCDELVRMLRIPGGIRAEALRIVAGEMLRHTSDRSTCLICSPPAT